MNNERLLSLFCELVQIESPSRDEAAMAKRCARELSEMGFSVEFDNSVQATGSTTGWLRIYRERVLGTLCCRLIWIRCNLVQTSCQLLKRE